jgi:multicomponent Na+:H+ antiporter subunit D
LKRTLTLTLDLDWFYRVAGYRIASAIIDGTSHAMVSVINSVAALSTHGAGRLQRLYSSSGIFSNSWPTGSMVLWVAVFLALYLFVNYFGGR